MLNNLCNPFKYDFVFKRERGRSGGHIWKGYKDYSFLKLSQLDIFLGYLPILICLIPAFFFCWSPISRAYGAIYQSTRGNAIVRVGNIRQLYKNKNILKGPCLRYDPTDAILIATPFGAGCWNAADWMVSIVPMIFLLSG